MLYGLYRLPVCAIILVVHCTRHIVQLMPIPFQKGGVYIFFFFDPIWELEAQLAEVSNRIPTRAELKELVIAAANGDN